MRKLGREGRDAREAERYEESAIAGRIVAIRPGAAREQNNCPRAEQPPQTQEKANLSRLFLQAVTYESLTTS